ncbi:MAG: hypothetical protein JWL83_574 [Actinomycetia bacterium]|nr:hypothetical protein [Actinomycetes bacterium]
MTTTDSVDTATTEARRDRPHFASRSPHFNHVAMSLPSELLREAGRAELVNFYSNVFGWEELPMLTDEGKRLVFQAYTLEQFVYLIADDPPMACPRLDHFGLSVGAESELDDILARAKAYRERDERVDIIDKQVDDHGMLAITSCYVRFLLPMMTEVQWWDMKDLKT